MNTQTREPRPRFDDVHLQWFGAGAPQTTTEAKEPQAGEQTGTGRESGRESPTGESVADSSNQSTDAAQVGAATVPKSEHDKLKADFAHLLQVHNEIKAREQKAKEEALKKRGEFEELYKTASSELEPAKAERDRYKAALEETLKAELATLPSGFDASLIPDVDPVAKLAWLRKARAAGILGTPKGQGDGTPPVKNERPQGLESLYTKM